MVDDEPPTWAATVVGDNLPPPRYNESTSSGRRRREPTSPPLLTEHVYTLGEKKKPWAFLKVKGRMNTKKTKNTPLFVQGDTITGEVELNLEKTEHIQAVTLQVRGETWSRESWTPELQATVPFWSQTTTLWSTSMGDPETQGSTGGSPKLKGKYVWPFSVTLPTHVSSNGLDRASHFELPPSFLDKRSTLHVDYKIAVTFFRGRLRLDHGLFTSFSYLPLTRPKAPSILRQLAYMEHLPPPGPSVEPEGWEVIGPTSAIGKLFDTRQVEAACIFALAKPLCYTRGTFIPFSVTITCSDSLALDLFAARGSLTVRLMRALHMKSDAMSRPKRAEVDAPTCVGTGVYWSSSEDNATADTRKLEGEIPLKQKLKPSFDFPLLGVKYHVSLALSAPGFSPTETSASDAALTLSREVTIASDTAPGPSPRSRARHGKANSELRDALRR